METELNQKEIDAMFRAARGGPTADLLITAWDYKTAGQLGREQHDAISALHENFARNLTNSIGAYLRIGFQATLVSAEHLSYRKCLANVPERSYLGSVKLAPFGAAALIQMDFAIAFPLIDVLLGGEGVGQPPSREITEIEEQILETIMRIICRELQVVWQPLGVEFQFELRQQAEQVQHLMPVEEKILALSFEISMKDSRGLVSVALPAVISNALLRKIAAGRPRAQARLGTADSAEHLRHRLLGCSFRLELQAQLSVPSAGDVAKLAVGKILLLNHRADGVAELISGDGSLFQARVARLGNMRAAQVIAPVDNEMSWKEQ
jgi:flagellar motor switch protein FliM